MPETSRRSYVMTTEKHSMSKRPYRWRWRSRIASCWRTSSYETAPSRDAGLADYRLNRYWDSDVVQIRNPGEDWKAWKP
jgi:hypothetical protein